MTNIQERMLQMLQLQEELQHLIVGPNWREVGHPQWRAAYMEATEIVDHLGWKWWKHQETDVDQLHLELVDIFHFLMNQDIIEFKGDLESLSNNYAHSFISTSVNNKKDDCIYYVENFIAYCINLGFIKPGLFFSMCKMFNLNFDRLYEVYMSKNLLNIFRQKNGYKDGSYIKNWCIESNTPAYEDNVFLASLVIDWSQPTAAQFVMEQLRLHYEQVLMFNGRVI